MWGSASEVLSFLLKVNIFIAVEQEGYEAGTQARCPTPIMLVMAAMGGHRGCVPELFQAGAYLEQTGAWGGMALGEAADKGHEGV